jgi:hypothetical protein
MGLDKNNYEKNKYKNRRSKFKRTWTRDGILNSLQGFRFCPIGRRCKNHIELIQKWKDSKRKSFDLDALTLFDKHWQDFYDYARHLMKRKATPFKHESKLFLDLDGKPYPKSRDNKHP